MSHRHHTTPNARSRSRRPRLALIARKKAGEFVEAAGGQQPEPVAEADGGDSGVSRPSTLMNECSALITKIGVATQRNLYLTVGSSSRMLITRFTTLTRYFPFPQSID